MLPASYPLLKNNWVKFITQGLGIPLDMRGFEITGMKLKGHGVDASARKIRTG